MLWKKLQQAAAVVGSVVIGLLAMYGVVSFLGGGDLVARAAGLVAPASVSTVPQVMNYQGILQDTLGNPLDGAYTLTFRIYDAVTAPTTDALWSEQHPGAVVREGYFNVLLGYSNTLSSTLFSQPDRFIGVTVDPYSEMTPRQRFASVPYAVYADHAADADHADNADHAFALSASDGDPADAVFVDGDGNVGIGTTSPSATLDVDGWIEMQGRRGSYASGTVPADGDWHPIVAGLTHYNAFEVIATWGSGTGAHAMIHAIAIRTYGPGGGDSAPASSGINTTSTFYGSVGNNCQPELTWTGTIYDYNLALRSLCSTFPSTSIAYHVTKLH